MKGEDKDGIRFVNLLNIFDGGTALPIFARTGRAYKNRKKRGSDRLG